MNSLDVLDDPTLTLSSNTHFTGDQPMDTSNTQSIETLHADVPQTADGGGASTLRDLFASMEHHQFSLDDGSIRFHAKDLTNTGVTIYGSMILHYRGGCDDERTQFSFPMLWSNFTPGVELLSALTTRAEKVVAQAQAEQEAEKAAAEARRESERVANAARDAALQEQKDWATYQNLKERFGTQTQPPSAPALDTLAQDGVS